MTTSRWFLVLLAFCSLATPSQAQDDDSTITLEVLRIPDAPGHILLGSAPSAVERPGTVQAFGLTLLSNAAEGTLFDEFAVQVSPFWLGGIPNLDFFDYEEGASGLEAIRRTLSFSVATDRSRMLDDGTQIPAIAAGARFSLFTGAIDRSYGDYSTRRDSAVAALEFLVSGSRELVATLKANDEEYQQLRAEADALPANSTDRLALEERLFEVEGALVEEAYRRAPSVAASTLGSLPEKRVGVVLDVAGGVGVLFPGSSFDEIRTLSRGAWVTGGYAGSSTTVLAVARYLNQQNPLDQLAEDQSTLDVGGRLIQDLAGGDLSFSAEGVFRAGMNEATDDRYRVAVELTYVLAPDRILSFTLGRDFEGEPTGNVLALLRLITNFGSGVDMSGLPPTQ